jgi:ATP-dependent Clp protease ATP-binding subunit ClpA
LSTTAGFSHKSSEVLRVPRAPKRAPLEIWVGGGAWLAKNGYDQAFGARPMARLIQQKIKEPLVDAVLFGTLQSGGTVVVDEANGGLTLAMTPA